MISDKSLPGLEKFTPAERRLIRRLNTPIAVQRFLNRMPYNTEPSGDTLRGFRQVVRRGTAHCLEAALFAACALDPLGGQKWRGRAFQAGQVIHVIVDRK